MTWYVGKNNTEIVLWHNPEGSLIEFRLIFLLYAVVGVLPEGALITADINPAELGYIPVYETWPEDVAHFHKKPSRETLQLAMSMLENATNLEKSDQTEIQEWIIGKIG